MINSPRLFAVIPAAGRSRRMGRPKLLLPMAGKPVIARLLGALDHPAIPARVVVVRPDDEPLRAAAAAGGAHVVQPDLPPAEMRTSVELAVREIARRFAPAEADAWLLVPADHPVLEPSLIDELIAGWKSTRAQILVPTFNGRRGHPTLFRWEWAERIAEIPPDRGLDWLLEHYAGQVVEFPVSTDLILCDLDTPDDYERLCRRYEGTESAGGQ